MLLNINILNYPFPFNFFFEKLCVFFVQLSVTAISQSATKETQRDTEKFYIYKQINISYLHVSI